MNDDSGLITQHGARWIRRVGLTSAALLAAVLLALSSLNLQTEQSKIRAQLHHRTDVTLPPSGVLRAGFLNFSTFAADLTWIRALQYFGHQKQLQRTPVSLETFADRIADLDPYFYEIYPWFVATYRGTHFPISVDDIQTMNRFLDRGIGRFPDRWRLPYKAGMNYIGYSQNRTPRRRLREVNHAIDYLQQASTLRGAPSTIPLTIGWLYERRRQLRETLESEDGAVTQIEADETDLQGQIEYLTDVYFLVEDDATRQQLRAMLKKTPEGRRALKQKIRGFREEFARHYRGLFSYLPADPWAWTVAQQPLPFASTESDTDSKQTD